MVTTRGKRLRAARKTRFGSAREAALALGIPVSTYGAHERAQLSGGRDFGPEEAKRYAQRFGVTPEWLLTGLETPFEPELAEETGSPKTRINIPVVGYIGAGVEAHYYDLSQYLDELERPRLLKDPTNVLEIRDRGLGSLLDRWLVFFDEMRHLVTPDVFGCFCVVATADGQIVVRRLQPGRSPQRYDLLSEFGTNSRDVAVSWVAKVTAVVPP
jgi:hypothetical protein